MALITGAPVYLTPDRLAVEELDAYEQRDPNEPDGQAAQWTADGHERWSRLKHFRFAPECGHWLAVRGRLHRRASMSARASPSNKFLNPTGPVRCNAPVLTMLVTR